MKQLLAAVVAVSTLALTPGSAWAQSDFPSRPLRILAGQPPGGATDMVARIIAHKLQDSLGQPVVVENRVGGGGIVAMDTVVKSRPDGHTMMLVGTSFLVLTALYSRLPFDPMNDMAPVARAASAPSILVAHPSFPARTIKELIAHAQANPGAVNYASSAFGSAGHMGGEMFQKMTGVKMTHVPYKSASAVMTDLVSGRVQISFASISSALGHVKSGKLRAIATTGEKRSSVAPDLPTVSEEGLAGFEVGSFQGLFVTARTPAAIITRLNRETVRGMNAPDSRARLAVDGTESSEMTPEEFSKWLNVQVPMWTGLAKSIGLKAE
jgi:tripartite-type tricarboxylate transporter receptor subunit TctC